MQKLLFLTACFLNVTLLSAQDTPPQPVRTFTPYTAPPAEAKQTVRSTGAMATQQGPGSVDLIADPKIERTMLDYAERKHTQQGYRVQIFLGDRKTAEDTKRTFLQQNPDANAYLSWLAPNFRLRVGDLRTRLEAERLLRELKVAYPGSYIVKDEIEPPMLPVVTTP
jgi:hypothetical protein